MRKPYMKNPWLCRRHGMVLFMVMGSIFVLTILVMSYNHLVQGKFNESREILKHLRAMKTAQAAARYIICKMKADLANPDTQAGSPGQILRDAFRNNDPAKLEEAVNAWLLKESADNSLGKLNRELFGSYPMTGVSLSPSITFSDLTPLSSLKEGDELFLDFEKAGIMTVAVEVFMGNTRELWQESRPFRVVLPFPLPVTKFTMYLRAATDGSDEMKFNTVNIDSPDTGDVAPGSPRPLVLFNGMPGDQNNSRDNIWEERGWIYLGGGKISLNRAGGHKKYGQSFYSYFPEADKPITLLFNFNDRSTGGPFSGVQVGNKNLIFSVARWGFSNALFNGPFADIWKKVLKGEVAAKDPGSAKTWWASSCMHLFGANGQTSGEKLISMTRVIGDIKDRFLEICYLADSSNRAPVGAVISLAPTAYRQVLSSNSGSQNSSNSFTSNLFMDELIYLSVNPAQALGAPDLREMEPFFLNLRYDEPGNVIAYKKIMSKIDSCSYDETYDMIAQYSKNTQKIDIPPTRTAPLVSDNEFKLNVMGIDCHARKIDEIAAGADTTLGLSKRVCYEIEAKKGEDVFTLLKNHFCMSQNSDFNLANAVIRIKTNGAGMTFGDNLGSNTGGSIIVDGPVKLGTFRQSSEPEKAPLLIMAEKGDITVKNSTHPTLAYLVALDKAGGKIKFASQDTAMNLLGGIAAHTIIPEDISRGGSVVYNTRLDPTRDEFAQHIGVVIGPAGGEK